MVSDDIWTISEDLMLGEMIGANYDFSEIMKEFQKPATSVRWRIKIIKSDIESRSREEMSAKEEEMFLNRIKEMCKYYMYHPRTESLGEARKKFFVPKSFFNSFFHHTTCEDRQFIKTFQNAFDHFVDVFEIRQQNTMNHRAAKATPEELKTVVDIEEKPADINDFLDEITDNNEISKVNTISVDPNCFDPIARPLVDEYNRLMNRCSEIITETEEAKIWLNRVHQSLQNLKGE